MSKFSEPVKNIDAFVKRNAKEIPCKRKGVWENSYSLQREFQYNNLRAHFSSPIHKPPCEPAWYFF